MTVAPAAIAQNLTSVRSRLAAAAAGAGRSAANIRLVAISKTFEADAVRAAAAAGQRDFGENRVQEGLQKKQASSDLQITWHLVGHLQSNKVRRAVETFEVIHSVDSVDLLQRLEAAALEQGRTPELLIQVDLAGETTKYGAAVGSLPALIDAAAACRAVRLAGLMTLPPFFDDPELVRPYFRRLRELRDEAVARGVPAERLRELSMGMSHDYHIAVQEGATIVRIGAAIFGARDV